MMMARIILGFGVGGYWAVAIASSARLVPKQKVARAVAVISAGISTAMVISVPFATFIGSHFNWRITFIASTILAFFVFLLQFVFLPKLPTEKGLGVSDFFGILRNRNMQIVLISAVFSISGHFAAYTFITPFFQQVTVIGPTLLSILMLGNGIMGIVGNVLGGIAIGRNLHRTMVTTMALFTIALMMVGLFGQSLIAATTGLLIWALAFGIIPLGMQVWAQASSPQAPEAAQAMITTVSQLSISFGSLLGGIIVDAINLTAIMWMGGGMSALSLVVVSFFGKRAATAET
ncbi:hypothetical protein J2TS4_09040 [Paenibacillus sp. J2TS4]|nr:hypothetical protein J2TS4_09040 [Paenibacillus sp. J2TS4]